MSQFSQPTAKSISRRSDRRSAGAVGASTDGINASFVFVKYRSYDGSEKSTWLLDNQAATLGQLEYERTIE